jgi:DNA-binding transcriptional LysR family regulator
LVRYPLILFSAETDLGAGFEVDHFVDKLARPHIAFRASSLGTMLTLVALGHGIGLLGSAQAAGTKRRDVVVRTVGGSAPCLATYVLHSSGGVSEVLRAFIEFARDSLSSVDSADALS